MLAQADANARVEAMRIGLRAENIPALAALIHISMDEVLRIIHVSKSTYHRRRKAGRLHTEESERALRLGDVWAKAFESCGTSDAAARWIQTPRPALGGESPLQRSDTEPGRQSVEILLSQIADGVVV